MVEAYLGHRLNHHELTDLVRRSEAGDDKLEDTFTDYSARETDWRGDVDSSELQGTLDKLGLNQRFAELDENQVWTAEDRALYRRLSQLGNDPSIAPTQAKPQSLSSEFVSTVEGNFAEWDRDGNIRLERQELDFLMAGGMFGEKLEAANDPEKAAALATMLRHHDLLGSGQPSDGRGISLADVSAWATSPELINSGAASGMNEVYQEYRQRAETLSQGGLLADEAIAPENIFQGVSGSCVLLSTLAGTEANQLKSMLNDNGDGTFEVRFADGATEVVREPSLSERLHHSQGQNGERWPALFEMAAAQRLMGEGGHSKDGLRGAIEGIDPSFAIPALTGKEAHRQSIDELSMVQTRELLEQATAKPGPVLCGSRPSALSDFINVEELHNGIANSHCYSIQGFDPKSDTVTLQNPWHKGEWAFAQDGKDDGVFQMPLKDFYSSYRWVAFAKES